MHRSGTSATTGALRLAGVSLGENLLGPGKDNPKGYWENSQAVAINEELLAAFDRTWDDIRPLPGGWESTTAAAQAAARIHALIDSEFAAAKVWAIKDPRLCRLVPVWRRVLAERGIRSTALLVARHPEEVAASIASRNNWSSEVGKLLWMRYVFESERYTRDMPRTVITYENLLADPVGALERAAQRLGIELPPREEARAQEFAGFIDSADRHHRHESRAPSSQLDAALADAYAALAGIEGDGGEWTGFLRAADAARDFLEPYAAGLDGLAAMSHYWQSRFAQVEVERAQVKSDFLAQVRWSEEAVERERALHEALGSERSRTEAIHEQLAAQHQEMLARLDALLGQNETLHGQRRDEQRRADAAELEVGRLQADLAQQREVAQRLAAEVEALRADSLELSRLNQEKELRILAIERSLSWRMSQPARSALGWLRRKFGN